MCGIAGLINCGNKHLLNQMTEHLAHRGPDNSGHQWFDRWQSGLGHRRLSIIDLSPAGHQPMSNVRGNLWITYNGEIYNYQEIRAQLEAAGCRFRSNSDTEVVLKAYEQWGETCLHKLNGMFAFAIFDQESGELLRPAIVLASSHSIITPKVLRWFCIGNQSDFGNRADTEIA